MYKAILFDLDGTLLNTTRGVISALKKTLKELALTIPPEEEIKKFVGPPMQLSIKNYYGFDSDKALEVANIFRKNYKGKYLFDADLYPNVKESLESLKSKKIKLAIATNKSHDNAVELLKKYEIDQYCDCIYGSDLDGKLQKADIIKKCLETMAVSKTKAVYIGDSIFDLKGAQKVGIDFIGVTYGFGFRSKEEIKYHNCIYTANTLGEVRDFLSKDLC